MRDTLHGCVQLLAGDGRCLWLAMSRALTACVLCWLGHALAQAEGESGLLPQHPPQAHAPTAGMRIEQSVQSAPPGGYDYVSDPVVSPTCESVAYVVSDAAARHRVVSGGEAGPACDLVDEVVFSDNGRRVAYVGRKDDWFFIVAGRQPGPKYENVAEPRFSSDGARLAYHARTGDGWHLVVDGRPGPAYARVRDATFAGNGRSVAYCARRGDRWFVVVNEREGPAYVNVRSPAFSPDGARVAYLAQRPDGSWCVVVGDREGLAHRRVSPPIFNRDGKHVAYVASDRGGKAAVMDEHAGPQHADIYHLMFTADGAKCAYVSRDGGLFRLFVDGAPGAAYDQISRPQFSADGKRVAYGVMRNGCWYPVIDGQVGPRYETCGSGSPIFSPDGKHVAYYVPSRFVVVDGQPGPIFNVVHHLGFSPDSKHFAYIAYEHPRSVVVVNGRLGPEHDGEIVGDLNISSRWRGGVPVRQGQGRLPSTFGITRKGNKSMREAWERGSAVTGGDGVAEHTYAVAGDYDIALSGPTGASMPAAHTASAAAVSSTSRLFWLQITGPAMNEQGAYGNLWMGSNYGSGWMPRQTNQYVELAPTLDAAGHQVQNIVAGVIMVGGTEWDFDSTTTGIYDSTKPFDIVPETIWSDHSITGHIDFHAGNGSCYGQCFTHQWGFTFHPLTVGIKSSGYSQEGSTAHIGQFTLTRTDNCNSLAPAIDLSGTMTFGGCAISDSDYTPLSDHLKFSAMESTSTILVHARDDTTSEWTEDVTASLPQNANFYIVANKQTARVEIVDNDPVDVVLANMREEAAGTPNEMDPGATVQIDDGDGNANGIPNYAETTVSVSGQALVPLVLRFQNDVKRGATVTLTMTNAQSFRLRDAGGTVLALATDSSGVGSIVLNPRGYTSPLSLHLQACAAGTTIITLTATDVAAHPSSSNDAAAAATDDFVDLEVVGVTAQNKINVGGFVPVNADNDNKLTLTNYVPATRDFDIGPSDAPAKRQNEKDMKQITLAARSKPNQQRSVRLTWVEAGQDRIKIWRSQDKQQAALQSGVTWALGAQPATLWVEGICEGSELRDVTLTLDLLDAQGHVLKWSDAKFTVVPVLDSLEVTTVGRPGLGKDPIGGNWAILSGKGLAAGSDTATMQAKVEVRSLGHVRLIQNAHNVGKGMAYSNGSPAKQFDFLGNPGKTLLDVPDPPGRQDPPFYTYKEVNPGTLIQMVTANDNPWIALVGALPTPGAAGTLDVSFILDLWAVWQFPDKSIWPLGYTTWWVTFAGRITQPAGNGDPTFAPSSGNANTPSSGFTRANQLPDVLAAPYANHADAGWR